MSSPDPLEERLRDLGRRLDHPDPQGVGDVVAGRLRGRTSRVRRRRPVAWLAAAAVLLVAGVAVAQFVIPGVDIDRVPTQPSAPVAGDLDRLGLGRRVSLEEARRRVEINVLVPAELGRPDAVFVGQRPAGGRVTLAYEPRKGLPRDPFTGAGMLVTLFRGTPESPFVEKEVGPQTSVRPVSIEGAPGMWIEGAPHQILYRDARERVFADSLRLAGNVLVWQVGEVTLRVESRLPLDPSLEVARSMA